MSKLIEFTAGEHSIILSLDKGNLVQDTFLRGIGTEEVYEEDTLNCLFECLRQGDIFFDVGAHIGYFTAFASKLVGETGRVISIEPEPRNYKKLCETILLNDLANVVPIYAVASDSVGTTTFHLCDDNDGGHSIWPCGLHPFNKKTSLSNRSMMVPSVTIDHVCQSMGITSIRGMKVDTEGAELLVFKGAQNILTNGNLKFLLFEVNVFGLQQMGTDTKELFDFVTSTGFAINDNTEHDIEDVYNVNMIKKDKYVR